MIATTLRRLAAPTALLAAASLSVPARAADASAWDGNAHAAARLIAGSPGGAALRAGVEIRLAPGWKTYWRYPGDSGVPPRFDFSRSENVASVAVQWPAPHRFTDDGGNSIGYKGGVIFPLRVVAQDPQRPVKLKLALDYAICEKLCVPAAAAADLALAGPSTHEAALAAAEAKVPRRAALASGSGLAIRSVRREAAGEKPQIVVEVAAPPGASVDLFAEGPTPDWALPLPEPADRAGEAPGAVRRFTFALDGMPPGAKPDGATITLTAVAGEEAIEVPIRLD
jgi:DsbC/DsbD-like thiol-disulfide interchange protein